MPTGTTSAAPALTAKVSVDGAPLGGAAVAQLTEIVLDDSVHLPDMIDLTFDDFNSGFLEANTGFKIGAKVKVELNAPGQPSSTFDGECVSIGASYHAGRNFATIRALDISHRLNRGRMTMTFERMTADAIFKKVIGELGIPCGTVVPCSVTFEALSMVNEFPVDFLSRLAAEHGLESVCEGGKMHMRKPETATPAIPLEVGGTILSLDVELSAADQGKDYQTVGWDPKKKEAVVGKAPVATKAAKVDKFDVAAMAQKMGPTKPFVVGDRFVDQQAHATAIAKATAEQHGSAFVDMRGTMSGNTAVRAGTKIKLEDVSKWLKGEYRLSNTRHIWNQQGGYVTEFTVSGQSDRSLGGLVAGAAGPPPGRTMSGLVTAIVTDNKDPNDWGRVKVALKWLDPQHQSGWARVAYPGAGNNRGITFIPEVNDEVYVAFEHGDPDRLIVLGGVYNGKDKFPDHKGPSHTDRGKTVHYGLYTDKGKLTISDKQGNEEMTLGLRDKSYIITIDKKGTVLSIGSDGKVEVTAKDNITITSKMGDIELKAGPAGNVKISGMNVSVEAKAGLTMKATGQAVLKGATVAIG